MSTKFASGKFGTASYGSSPLLLWANGTFANASSRYIWDASGNVLFGAFAGGEPAVATIGGKRRLQIEGARTNRMNVLSAWALGGACVRTAGQADPAGGTTAFLFGPFNTADSTTSAQDTATISQPIGISLFCKRVDATGTLQVRSAFGSPNGLWTVDYSLMGTGWERLTDDHPAVTVNNAWLNFTDGRQSIFIRDTTSGAHDASLWFPQVPDEVFPSSPIAEATTRAADSMTFGAVPTAMRSGRWSTEVTVMHKDADLATSEVMYLYFVDSNNYLAIEEDGAGNVQIKWKTTSGTVVKTVTYSRDQTPRVTVDFTTGDLLTAGFTTGDGTTNGTVSDWPATTLYVGHDSSTLNSIFGRMSEPEAA